MKLTAIVGSMFSGKSTLLNKQIRESRRHEVFHVMVFKPSIDDRYDVDSVTTHDFVKESANMLIHRAEDIWEYYLHVKDSIEEGKKVICFIDEVQFLEADSLVRVIRMLNRENVQVCAAGLDMDKFGLPFGATPKIMAIADEVVKLKTKCDCGEDSYTQVSITNNKDLIEIGSDSYKPVCKKCYFDYMDKEQGRGL